MNYNIIKESFEINADKERSKQMAAYMRNKFDFYGIAALIRKSIYKDDLKIEKKNTRIDWSFLDKCWEDSHREFQYLVMDYLSVMQNILTYKDITNIKKYIKTKQWWDTIDGLDKLIGNIAFSDNRVDDLMLKWSKDEDFWLRRIAIDHQLSRKEKTDKDLLEKIIINNFGTDEFFVNKAIGWSLRQYSKTNPLWVRGFIDKYKDRMNKLSIREASKYIS